MNKIEIKEGLKVGVRLDKQLHDMLRHGSIGIDIADLHLLSRTMFSKKFTDLVSIHDSLKPLKASYKYREGEVVLVDVEGVARLLSEVAQQNRSLHDIVPETGSLDIVFENQDFLVINKAPGIVVHPGSKNSSGTLANYVMGYLQSRGEYDMNIKRAGIVHRLDKPVSGLILFAKRREVQEELLGLFQRREVVKLYSAKHDRPFPDAATNRSSIADRLVAAQSAASLGQAIDDLPWKKVEGYIGRDPHNRLKMRFSYREESDGREGRAGQRIATLNYVTEGNRSLIHLLTGRTHQIRSTFSYLSNPIVGDKLYGSNLKSEIASSISLRSVGLQFRLNGESYTFIL